MKFKKAKTCACGVSYQFLPKNFCLTREKPAGVWWDCQCHSTIFLPMEDLNDDFCECAECLDKEQPCLCDCELDAMCLGCIERQMADDDCAFDSRQALRYS